MDIIDFSVATAASLMMLGSLGVEAFELTPVRGFIRTRKVGGLRFIWIGPLVMSFCVSRR